MVNKELCKLCGKPKEEHYYLELFNEWCCTPTEDIYNSDRFTPKKSNDSHSSQSGSKTNDKTSSENHSSFKTLKSSGSDTLFQIEQRIRKGCGRYIKEEDRDCGQKYGYYKRERRNYIVKKSGYDLWLCPTCQAQLNLIEEIKEMKTSEEKQDENS